MLRRAIALGLGAAAASFHLASAQTSPGIVSPSRPDQNPVPAQAGADLSRQPSNLAGLRVRNPNKPFAPFTLTRVEISGTSLPMAALDPAWRPLIGGALNAAALDKLVNAVADRYGKSDVALYTVLVPDQTFAGGVLKLQVLEGYVEGARLDGVTSQKRIRLIRRYLAPLLKERPLGKASLQRQVSLIRDMPGLYPTLNFERGDQPGAVRLMIKASPRSVQLGLGANNRGTALLGRTQGQADLYAHSLIFGGDQLHATLVTPLEADLFRYYSLAYSVPLDAGGTTLQANVGYLDTHPRAIPLRGNAYSLGVQLSRPIVRSYDTNLYLTGSLDGVNSDNALLGRTFTHENVRTVRLAVSYSRSTKKNVFTVSGTGSFGISGLGAREFDPGLSRLDFRKFNAKLVDNLAVSRNFILRLDGFVQATGDPLPISEQLALGGDEFGRAYEAAIISGDYGEAGSAELAWRPAKRIPNLLKGSEIYAFVDGGEVHAKGRFGFPGSTSRLASLGGGVRADVAARTVVQLEAARGLYNPAAYENREVWRLFAEIRTLF